MYEIMEECPYCGVQVRMKLAIGKASGVFMCPSCRKTAEYIIALALIWDDEVIWN